MQVISQILIHLVKHRKKTQGDLVRVSYDPGIKAANVVEEVYL